MPTRKYTDTPVQETKPRGRPRKPQNSRRDHQVCIRTTAANIEFVRAAAAAAELTLADWVVRATSIATGRSPPGP